MKILRTNLGILYKISGVKQCKYSTFVNRDFQYTSDLYQKNYIKYPVQSRSAISHDYVYHGRERLPSLKERMKEYEDPTEIGDVDIGKNVYFSKLRELKKSILQTIEKNKKDEKMERLAKDLLLKVPIDKIEEQTKAFKYFKDVVKIANHYKIYKDLFENGFFRPAIDLNVKFSEENSLETSVYCGNKISASKMVKKPLVNWSDVLECGQESKYHTLMLINLDGNFQNNDEQVLHWFMGNIEKNDINSGQELMQYMQPIPMRGSGWHRCVFVLYEHDSKINFELENATKASAFEMRCFDSKIFFNKYQNDLTPIGLSFYQTEWDLSVRDAFQNILNIKEPVYAFDHGPRFIPKFEKFAHGQAFNWYLSEYNDRKEINEYIIKDYLRELSPFEAYPTPAKYPVLDVKQIKPRWYKYEIENKRLRDHEWNIVPFKYSHRIDKKLESLKHLPYQQD